MEVMIIDAGIRSLTLGLMQHQAGIPLRVYCAAPATISPRLRHEGDRGRKHSHG